MEFVEDTFDSNGRKPVYFNLTEDKLVLLRRRGFFPTSTGLIDDVYYEFTSSINAPTHLKGDLSIKQLVEMACEDMEEVLFKKDSTIAMPVTFNFNEPYWDDSFGEYKRYCDVEPLCLEPYIARYIRAINRCGMKTFYSCDGWHNSPAKSKELVILFSDRYSWIWHKLMYKRSYIQKVCNWEHKHSGSDLVARIVLPIKDDGKLKVYNQIITVANTIIENSDYLISLKEHVVQNIFGVEINSLTDSEAEKKIEDVLSMLISDIG